MRLELHDPWVLLGAIAQATERVRLGVLVTPLPRRRPAKFAREVTTLDHLSSGRVVVGVGLGEPPDDDFAAFGDDPDPRVRAARLDEALTIATALWSAEPMEFHGQHLHAVAHFAPSPVQRPHPPIWVACGWPRRGGLRRARRWQGIVPISSEGQPLPPETIVEIVAALAPVPEGFDVVASQGPGHTPAEYEAAGATWLVESRWPDGDWFRELETAAARGPQA